MTSLLTSEELRDTARRLLQPHRERRGSAADLWAVMIESGWLALAVPEEFGGLGQPFAALATLYQELGRVPVAQPFMGASIGLGLLVATQRQGADLQSLIDEAIGGTAIVVSASCDPDGLPCAAALPGGIAAAARFVADAGQATHLLLPVTGDELTLLLIARSRAGVGVHELPTWDSSRRVAHLEFSRDSIDRALPVLRGAAAVEALTDAAAHFDLALACDALGGSEQIFQQTLDYMKVRQQFGRTIAGFQALKHRCADLAMELAAAGALVRRACGLGASAGTERRAAAAVARLYAGSVYCHVTEEAVQLHGGIGFTWDHDCHIFLKRARLDEVLGGAAARRKDTLARSMFSAACRERTDPPA